MPRRGSIYLVSNLRKEHFPFSFWAATPTLLFPSHFPATSKPPSDPGPFAEGGQALGAVPLTWGPFCSFFTSTNSSYLLFPWLSMSLAHLPGHDHPSFQQQAVVPLGCDLGTECLLPCSAGSRGTPGAAAARSCLSPAACR